MLRLKTVSAVLLVLVLAFAVFAGCGAPKNENTGTQNTGDGEVQKNSSSAKSLRVFQPDELLSQAEAAELTGHPVTLKTDSLRVDPETGRSMTYYEYDIPSGTLNAGLFLWQDSAAKENTAEPQYESDLGFVKDDQKPVSGLGEKAFYQPSNSQMHVLHSGIYFIVAFEDYDSSKNESLNLKIAQKVIENINKKK